MNGNLPDKFNEVRTTDRQHATSVSHAIPLYLAESGKRTGRTKFIGHALMTYQPGYYYQYHYYYYYYYYCYYHYYG